MLTALVWMASCQSVDSNTLISRAAQYAERLDLKFSPRGWNVDAFGKGMTTVQQPGKFRFIFSSNGELEMFFSDQGNKARKPGRVVFSESKDPWAKIAKTFLQRLFPNQTFQFEQFTKFDGNPDANLTTPEAVASVTYVQTFADRKHHFRIVIAGESQTVLSMSCATHWND
jgi:hypothetical protein